MTYHGQFLVPQVRSSVATVASAPAAWEPDSSDELTAFQTLAGSTKAHIWTFDGASNRQDGALQGAVQDAQPIGLAYDWNNPTTEAYRATASGDGRPVLDTVGGITGALFDGDREDNAGNSRLLLPHITAPTGFAAALVRLTRADAGAQEAFLQINHWRAGMYWGAVGEAAPHVRAGNNVRISTGGASPLDTWTAVYVKWQTGTNYLATRRSGGEWQTGTLDSSEPWMSASSSTQTSLLGRGGYDASAGPPFSGLIHRVIILEKLPADADEEQTLIDMLLLDTGLTDTAPEEGETPDPGGDYVELVDPLSEVNVSTYSELAAAVAAAVPGRHIILANGTYTGSLTLSADGTAGAPIVIRSLNNNGATISGGITVSGDYWTIHRVDHAGSTGITVSGRDFRWLRGELSPTAGQKVYFTEAAYNGEVGFFVSNGGANAIEVDVDEDYTGSFRPSIWIHHGWIKGTSGSPVEIGLNYRHSLTKQHNCLEYCIVEDCGNNSALAMKSSENLFAFVTVLDCGTRRAGTRHGSGNIWYGVRIVNSAGIILRGSNNKCVGCVKVSGPTGAWSDMGACAGDTDYFTEFVVGTDSGTRYHPNAIDCKFIGCTTHTSIRDGGTGSSYTKPATRTRIEGNPLPSIVVGPGPTTGRTTSTTLSEAVPDVVVLSSANAAHVGVDADWSTGPSVRYLISPLGVPPAAAPTVAQLTEHPFSSASAFNRPIGDGATFSATAPLSGYPDGTVADDNVFSNQVVLATSSHPVANFVWSGALSGVGLPFSIRFPASGFPTYSTVATFDCVATVVTESDGIGHDIYKIDTRAGVREAAIHREFAIDGLGHGTVAGWGNRVGASAAGNAVLAGTLRKKEFETPGLVIGHAHHIALPWQAPNAFINRKFQLPAVCHDGFAETNSTSAPCAMGELLAIKSSDLSAVLTAIDGLAISAAAKEMCGRYATAFCHYGIYVTDSAGQASFRADAVLDATLKAAFIVFLKNVAWSYLYRVTNSVTGATGTITTGAVLTGSAGTLTYPAGGGTALAPNRALV